MSYRTHLRSKKGKSQDGLLKNLTACFVFLPSLLLLHPSFKRTQTYFSPFLWLYSDLQSCNGQLLLLYQHTEPNTNRKTPNSEIEKNQEPRLKLGGNLLILILFQFQTSQQYLYNSLIAGLCRIKERNPTVSLLCSCPLREL